MYGISQDTPRGYLSWRCDGASHVYVNGINVEINGYVWDNCSGYLVVRSTEDLRISLDI
jgi:hypothetical protein